jgi:amino acid transporter
MKLKKSVTTSGILFASISAMIGSGWLFGPLFAAQYAGNAAILSWIIGGLLVVIIALTYAEVITAIPISGGISSYPFITHGKFVGFILGWIFWLSVVFAAPIEVQATLQYASNYLPWLTSRTEAGFKLTTEGFFVAIVLMFCLSFINSISVKFMTETNKFLSLWKLAVPLIIVACFVYYSSQNQGIALHGPFAAHGLEGILKAISVGGVIYAFNGFQYGLMLAGEAKKPSLSIPFSAIGSILCCLVIYTLLQVGFLVSIPVEYLKDGWHVLSFPGDAGPLAGLAALLGFFWLVELIYVDAVVATMGAGVVQCSTAARSLYAMSLSGHLPQWFSKLNKGRVPLLQLFWLTS